jgi:hypothetical protein
MVSDATMQLIVAHGFSPEALEANRAGILTPEQARSVTRRGNLAILVGFALGLFLLITGIIGLKSPQFFADQVPLGSTGLVAYLSIGGGVVILVLAVLFALSLPADLLGRRVASRESLIRKYVTTSSTSDGDSQSAYHYRVDRLRFDVGRVAYDMLDPGRRYRVYYLPRTKILVNLEPIDTPLA